MLAPQTLCCHVLSQWFSFAVSCYFDAILTHLPLQYLLVSNYQINNADKCIG